MKYLYIVLLSVIFGCGAESTGSDEDTSTDGGSSDSDSDLGTDEGTDSVVSTDSGSDTGPDPYEVTCEVAEDCPTDPPPPKCFSGSIRTFTSGPKCTGDGQCTYEFESEVCPDGCETAPSGAAACATVVDLCDGVVCEASWSSACTGSFSFSPDDRRLTFTEYGCIATEEEMNDYLYTISGSFYEMARMVSDDWRLVADAVMSEFKPGDCVPTKVALDFCEPATCVEVSLSSGTHIFNDGDDYCE